MFDVGKELSSLCVINRIHVQNHQNPADSRHRKVTIGGKEIAYTLHEMKSGKWGFHL